MVRRERAGPVGAEPSPAEARTEASKGQEGGVGSRSRGTRPRGHGGFGTDPRRPHSSSCRIPSSPVPSAERGRGWSGTGLRARPAPCRPGSAWPHCGSLRGGLPLRPALDMPRGLHQHTTRGAWLFPPWLHRDSRQGPRPARGLQCVWSPPPAPAVGPLWLGGRERQVAVPGPLALLLPLRGVEEVESEHSGGA